jgi:hypothetical protein
MKRKKLSLPVVDPSRTAFGIPRTRCACAECLAYCHFLPGYLVPEDLTRMIPADADPLEWARSNLRASPGAVVASQATGRTWRIATLVPARGQGGACINLDGSGRCRVHDVAPFGCAFFDHTQGRQALSLEGLRAVDEAQRNPQSLYHRLWSALRAAGLVAPPPEELRERMEQARAAKVRWWQRRPRKGTRR